MKDRAGQLGLKGLLFGNGIFRRFFYTENGGIRYKIHSVWWANTFPRIYDLAVMCFFVKPDRAFGYFSEVCIYWLISWINFCSCQVFSYIVENSGTTVTPAMKAWVKYFARRSVINDCFPYQGKVSQRNITRYLGTVDSETKVFKPTTFPTLEETTCYYAFLEKLPYTNCGQEGVNSR